MHNARRRNDSDHNAATPIHSLRCRSALFPPKYPAVRSSISFAARLIECVNTHARNTHASARKGGWMARARCYHPAPSPPIARVYRIAPPNWGSVLARLSRAGLRTGRTQSIPPSTAPHRPGTCSLHHPPTSYAPLLPTPFNAML